MTLADPITDALVAACNGKLGSGTAVSNDGAEVLDLAEVGLLLGALDRRGADLGPYRAHLADIARTIRNKRPGPDAHDRRKALCDVIAGEFAYNGDGDVFEAPENANMLDVIDRRVGLPVALGILYLHAARAAGWAAYGIAFPGHFLVRVEGDADAAMLDPFDNGRAMEPADLYSILRRLMGPGAKLEEEHLAPMPDRSVLIRLLSNLKAHALRDGDTSRGLELLDRMRVLRPRDAAILFEQGTILARTGSPMAAKAKFETILTAEPEGNWAARASHSLARVKITLN